MRRPLCSTTQRPTTHRTRPYNRPEPETKSIPRPKPITAPIPPIFAPGRCQSQQRSIVTYETGSARVASDTPPAITCQTPTHDQHSAAQLTTSLAEPNHALPTRPANQPNTVPTARSRFNQRPTLSAQHTHNQPAQPGFTRGPAPQPRQHELGPKDPQEAAPAHPRAARIGSRRSTTGRAHTRPGHAGFRSDQTDKAPR